MPKAALGAVVFAITLVNPNMAVAGFVAVLAAYGFARLVRMENQFLESGYYTYNPLLVGLSLGYLFKISALSVFFVVAAGVATFLVTVSLANILATYLRLPVLSVPSVIVSSIAYLGSLRYLNLLVGMHNDSAVLLADLGLPSWLAGYFRAFGAVLFAPSVVVGLTLSLAVLCFSRVLFFLSLLGYFAGALIRGLMLGSAAAAFGDVDSFIFIAMAVGGVFLIPSPTSYLFAGIAVAIPTMSLDAVTCFWSAYGIPAFTLPFNVVCLGFVYVLGLLRHPMVAARIGRTPEETVETFIADQLRFPGSGVTLYLPFAGRWKVWQGFDGPWTNKGSWRYAYDFVIVDEKGRTHAGDGGRLEDYYCFNKPVLAPVRGRVVQLVDDQPDSAIGHGDWSGNWGNLVVIQDPRGFFVELSHFAAGSLRVGRGDWVERGAVLGSCGSSGYSPQPHIHVQVQATDTVGAAPLPFSFASYAADDAFVAGGLPGPDDIVEPLYPNKRLDGLTSFVLDETHAFAVHRGGAAVGRLELQVKMAADGSFFFVSPRGQLYFGKHEGTFYFYRATGDDPWLRLIFLALPRLPLACRDGLRWRDFVPASLVAGRVRAALVGCVTMTLVALAFPGTLPVVRSGLFGVNGVLFGWAWILFPELPVWFKAVATVGGAGAMALVTVPVATRLLRWQSRFCVFSVPSVLAVWAAVALAGWCGLYDGDLLKGWTALHAGDWATAQERFSAAAVSGDRARAYREDGLGWARFMAGDYAAAAAHFAAGTALAPDLADAFDGRGWSAFRRGQFALANEMFLMAVRRDPWLADAWDGLGWIAWKESRVQDARRCFSRAVAAAPLFGDAWDGLARSLAAAGDRGLADLAAGGARIFSSRRLQFVPALQIACWGLFLVAIAIHSRLSGLMVVAGFGCLLLLGRAFSPVREALGDFGFLGNFAALTVALGGQYRRLDGSGVTWAVVAVASMALAWPAVGAGAAALGMPVLWLPCNVLLFVSLLVARRPVPLEIAATNPETVRLWAMKQSAAAACWRLLGR